MQEERKLANAIEEQRLADTRLAEKQLELELRRIEENKESEQDKKVIEISIKLAKHRPQTSLSEYTFFS